MWGRRRLTIVNIVISSLIVAVIFASLQPSFLLPTRGGRLSVATSVQSHIIQASDDREGEEEEEAVAAAASNSNRLCLSVSERRHKDLPRGRPQQEGEGDGNTAVMRRHEALVDGINDVQRQCGQE